MSAMGDAVADKSDPVSSLESRNKRLGLNRENGHKKSK